MQVLLTSRVPVKTKAGSEFALYKGISNKGETIEIFVTPAQEEEFSLSNDVVLDKEALESLFAENTTVDVQYNNRGRVDSVAVND